MASDVRRFRAAAAMIILVAGLFPACSSKGTGGEPNIPPVIDSPSAVAAVPEEPLVYVVTFTDPDGPDTIITFIDYPSWLAPDGDSLSGIPGAGDSDTGFVVVVSDGIAAETLSVAITFAPVVVVYGDSRTGHNVHRQVVEHIVAACPVAVFHTGDLVENGTIADQWVIFNDITASMRMAADFYPSLGNHEYQAQLYFDNFELPNNEQWYAVDIGRMHFIILNTNVAIDTTSEQYRWLVADLEGRADSIDFTAAVFHHPPYTTGPHTEDEKGLRAAVIPLFEMKDVDVVFNGHVHAYERLWVSGVYYVVTGGGGAPLHTQARQAPYSEVYLSEYHFCALSAESDRVVINVYDIDGELIDRLEILR